MNKLNKKLVGISLALIALILLGFLYFIVFESADNTEFTSDTFTTGTTYYIDSVAGNDKNNGTSIDTPWKTTDILSSKTFAAGDKILFKKGSVFNSANTMVLKGNGTSSARITVDAYGTGDLPVISNSGPSIYDYVIKLEGTYFTLSNIVIDNLTYQSNVTEDGIRVTGSNNNLTKIEARNVGHGIAIVGASNINITEIYVHDGQMIVNDATPFNDYGAGGVVVMNNSSNVKISKSRFINLMPQSIDYGTDGSALELYNQVSNVEFFNNYTEKTDNVFEVGGINASDVVSGISVHHNILIDARALAAFNNNVQAGNYGITTRDVKIDHNTVIRKGLEQGWRVLWFQTAPGANEFFVRNNIFEIDKVYGFAENYGQMVHSGNVYKFTNFNNEGLFTLDATEKRLSDSENINFVDPANKNYQLQSTSKAVNGGTFLGYTLDYVGNPIPLDTSGTNKPDVGTYELVETPSTCGNSIVEGVEVCDDGNTVDGDQCSSICRNSCASPLTWNGTTCIAPADVTAPTVSVSSPSNNASFSKGTTINIVASAGDNVKVAKVEFYTNSTLTCTDTSAEYSCKIKTDRKSAASYVVIVKAYDTSGNTTSTQIVVTTN